MPNTANQGVPYPATTAVVDVPADIRLAVEYIETRVVMRFASAADRTAKRPAPVAGELCFLTDQKRYDYYTGTDWRPFGSSVFVARSDPGTTGSTPAGASSTVVSVNITVPDGLPGTARYRIEADCFVSTNTGIGSSIGMTGASDPAPTRIINQSASYDGHLVGYDIAPAPGPRTYNMIVTSITAGQTASWRFPSMRVDLQL